MSSQALPRGISLRCTAEGRAHYLVRLRRKGRSATCTFADLNEALDWRIRALHALDSGSALPAKPSPPEIKDRECPLSVAEAAKEWLRGCEAGTIRTRYGGRYGPRSTRAHAACLRRDILPMIGNWPVDSLRPKHGREIIATVFARTGHKYTLLTMNTIRVIYHWLVETERGGVEMNPFLGLRIPTDDEPKTKKRVLDPTELEALLGGADAYDRAKRYFPDLPTCHVSVLLAANYALRSEETRALRFGPEGLDLDAGTLAVTVAADDVKDEDDVFPLLSPKTRAGHRLLTLTRADLTFFRTYALQRGRPEAGTYVLTAKSGGATNPNFPNAQVRGAYQQAEIAPPHPTARDLRRTWITHAIAAGVSLPAVAAFAGQRGSGLMPDDTYSLQLDVYAQALAREVAEAPSKVASWRAEQAALPQGLPHTQEAW
jgi:integrase